MPSSKIVTKSFSRAIGSIGFMVNTMFSKDTTSVSICKGNDEEDLINMYEGLSAIANLMPHPLSGDELPTLEINGHIDAPVGTMFANGEQIEMFLAKDISVEVIASIDADGNPVQRLIFKQL